MSILQQFDKVCADAGSDANSVLNDFAKLIAAYSFYHYLNGDQSQLDELGDSLCYESPEEWSLAAVFQSTTIDGNAVDFLVPVSESSLQQLSDRQLTELVLGEAKTVGKVVLHDHEAKVRVRRVFDQLGIHAADDDSVYFTIKILCNWTPKPERKIWLQNLISNCEVANKKVGFELIFADDIEQEIDDIESPREYVPSGTLDVFRSSSFCPIGDEGSFLTVISAKSLKTLFLRFGTRGLFASNLRFFISAKRIDPKIIESIQQDSENFVYYNNGIIITCDDFRISGRQLMLTDFSIVNGGQTTNLIGRTPFNADFGVVCKVIKSKYSDRVKKAEFLAKVAEASNTQKPINAKDLIANRKEQRLLKEQCSRCGIFLKIKRGEKINKSLYPDPWQNASNDELAQMIYSAVFQMPGSAKNSRAALLSNEKTYDLIFKSDYADEFLVSLQNLKVGFSNWKRNLLNKESKSSPKIGLARTGDLLSLAVIGLIVKFRTNQSLVEKLRSVLSDDTETVKFAIGQNDIGQHSLINPKIIGILGKSTLNSVFDFIFDNILLPAYRNFKVDYPNYAYLNFNKAQSYYFRYVVPSFLRACDDCEAGAWNRLSAFLNFDFDGSFNYKEERNFEDYKPGLFQELSEFRKAQSSSKGLAPTEIFSNMQMTHIQSVLPKTILDLEIKCRLRPEQITNFGEGILRIVKKYCDISQFEGSVNHHDR